MKEASTMKRLSFGYKTALLATSAIIAVSSFSNDAYSRAQNGVITDGSASITYTAKSATVNQNSMVVGINWDSLDTAIDESLIFNQINSDAIAVNKVIGDLDGTSFDGILKANGNVVILDQNGVIFGKNSFVDVGGLIVSTGDADVSDFTDNIFTLSEFGEGSIVNKGYIRAASYGLVALIGNNIRNDGFIEANYGTVALAEGDVVTVDLYGDNLLEFAVNSESSSIKNYGVINVGKPLEIELAGAIVGSTTNLDGFEEASVAMEEGGKIILSGGNVKLFGSLDADGNAGGGEISITGTEEVKIYEGAELNASALIEGDGGLIDISSDNLDFMGAANLIGQGDETIGGFLIIGANDLNLTEESMIDVSSFANMGDGGHAIFLGSNIDVRGSIYAEGSEGGHAIIFGDDITLAGESYLSVSSSSDEGSGGIIEIEGSKVSFRGNLHADAGNNVGDGGDIAISGIDYLAITGNISAKSSASGNNGIITIDPVKLNISPAHVVGESYIIDTSLSSMLLGADVELIASDEIFVYSGINVSSYLGLLTTGDLTLTADKSVFDGDFTMGSGIINFNTDIINLNGLIKRKEDMVNPAQNVDRNNSTTIAYEVNVLSDSASIQQAIELVDINGTVNVADGNYYENLVVDKESISIFAFPSLDATEAGRSALGANIYASYSDDAVYINADDITFSGFNIIGGETSIYANQANGINISNNYITSPNYVGAPEPVGKGVGIYVYRSYEAGINNNFVSDTDNEGIMVYKSGDAVVTGNVVEDTDSDGIEIRQTSNSLVEDNNVNGAGTEGIEVADSDNVDVINNIVYNSGTAISINGHHRNISNIVVRDNDIFNSEDSGIRVAGTTDSSVTSNFITSSGNNGIYLSGFLNGDILIDDNIITDNETGMRFESGIIDLTGLSNIVTGGAVGFLFDPVEIFSPEYYNLSLVDDTIGTTLFDEQNEYYIKLGNGALFNPGTPTIIDGTNASYDGLIPSINGLTQAQYDALEDSIYHYNDENILGLFDFGEVNIDLVDEEDIFPSEITGALFRTGNSSLTITGLPPIDLNDQVFNPSDLNNISPQAGGEEDYNDAESVANIEPAAGAEEVSCWTDMASIISSGQSASFSFGNSLEQMISSGISCNKGKI